MKTKHHSNLPAPVIQSGDQTPNNTTRPRWFALAFGGFLFTSLFALPAPLAEAQCQQWSVGHGWRFKQGTINVDMNLHQNGTVVTGTASHVIRAKEIPGSFGTDETVSGTVDGTVEGDQFAVKIEWKNNTTGVYEGTIGPSGKIEGKGWEIRSPRTKVRWYSETRMVCADAAPATTTAPAPAPKPAAPAATAADWVGRWDTTTDQGGHFELVLKQDGDAITGVFRDLNGNSQYDGTLSGTLSGKVLNYRFTQPEFTGTGAFTIANKGTSISGEGRLKDAAKTRFFWWGSKTN